MIFCFFSVGAVLNLLAIELIDAHCSDNGKGNALVSRAKDYVKIQAKVVMNSASIIKTQLVELLTSDIGTCIHEERRFATTLKRKIAKFKYVALDHKLNKFALVVFHGFSFSRPFDAAAMCGYVPLH